MRIASMLLVIGSWLAFPAAAAQAECGHWCPWGCSAKREATPAVFTQVANTKSATPSMLTRMTSGTKRLMSNTMGVFVPKKSTPKKKATGTTAVYSRKPKQDEPGFFHKLFHPEPPPPPKTVKEWMSLEQVLP